MRTLFAIWACLAALQASAASAQYVVQVSVDGLAANFLQSYLSNAPAGFPTFTKLVREGASTFNARCDYDISETIPNHATMLTARPTSQTVGLSNTVHHGWTSNFPAAGQTFHNGGNTNLDYVPSSFDVAHDYGLRTGFYVSKDRLSICELSYNAVHGAHDLIEEDNGRDKIDFSFLTNGFMATVVDRLVTQLNSTNPPSYNFIHLTEPDTTGHRSGWGTLDWSNAVRQVDTQIGRILAVVSTNSRLAGQTIVIVTADHGGGGVNPRGHTEAYHPQNFTIPFFIWGPSIPEGVDAYTLFSNRHNPGTNRVTYAQENQPIRNGDGSNLALNLLGLPPIPGSFMIPQLVEASITLNAILNGDEFTIWWPVNSSVYTLEEADPSEAILDWQPVASEAIENSGSWTYSVNITNNTSRLYRLVR